MADINHVAVPNGSAALAWSGRRTAGINTILFYNPDPNSTVYLGQTAMITAAGPGTFPISPNGYFSGDPVSNWYVAGGAAGIKPLVVVPNGQSANST